MEIECQQELGDVGLLEEDKYLADVNLGDLENTLGVPLHYWLLEIKTARKAKLFWGQQEQHQTVSGETTYGTGQVIINFQYFYEVTNVFHVPSSVCFGQTFLSHATKDCRIHVYVKKRVILSYVTLKQGWFVTVPAPLTTPTASSKVFAHKRLYYEAGLELKGEDKHAAYVKQIGLLFENIQLDDPTAIMHASVESATAKLLGSKSEMSNNMAIFPGYATVGRNSNVFKPKTNNNKKKGRHGKDEPDVINLSVYPTLIFSPDVDPDTITSQVTHEFGRAGEFYFRKKELQCIEMCTIFIIYYLYTFYDLATIQSELTSLIGKAYKGMQDNFILPKEFEHHQLPKINIR